jgi:hypothetical protein
MMSVVAYWLVAGFNVFYYGKRPIFKKYIFPPVPSHSDPNILGPTPNFKICTFFSSSPEVSQNNRHIYEGQKHREEIIS